jgi:putative hydrolases of HD superfamily
VPANIWLVVTSPTDTLTLLHHLLKLKTTPRSGWRDRGVPPAEAESIADHVLITALIGWLTAGADLDRDRVLKLALVHDLAEAISGDPPPYDRTQLPPDDDPAALRAFFSRRQVRPAASRAEKHRAEAAAMQTLRALMPETASEEIGALWDEYGAQTTAEARFVKDLDRFEAFVQALDYARRFPSLPFDGFTDMARQEITDPTLSALRDALLADEKAAR